MARRSLPTQDKFSLWHTRDRQIALLIWLLLGSLLVVATTRLLAAPLWLTKTGGIAGTVYQDANASGQRDADEAGMAGITVTAFDETDRFVAQTISSVDGRYKLPGLENGRYRIEFTTLPLNFQAGPVGAGSGSQVQFANSEEETAVDLGILSPASFCEADPPLLTTQFTAGDSAASPLLTVTSQGHSQTPISPSIDLGAVWGLAHHAASDTIFAAAFTKRHTAFGDGGPGTIYQINRQTGEAKPFVTLAAGDDPHPAGTDLTLDPVAWDAVGKVGLGDVELADNGRFLYTVNLHSRTLVQIELLSQTETPVAGAIQNFPTNSDLSQLPGLESCPDAAMDIRPFGLGSNGEEIYVGLVCTAQSTTGNWMGGEISPGYMTGRQNHFSIGHSRSLRGYVYEFSPSANRWTQLLDFSLNYPRGCVTGVCDQADTRDTAANAWWRPWTDTFTYVTLSGEASTPTLIAYPQPWLTDIVVQGERMQIGLRDRFGDQTGQSHPDPFANDAVELYRGQTAGDLLTACWHDGDGMWAICEPDAEALAVTDAAQTAVFPPAHESGFFGGGLAMLPMTGQLIQTIAPTPDFDSTPPTAGWIALADSPSGSASRVAIQTMETAVGGLGDLEPLCDPSPMGVSSRVWLDADRDGLQDSDEQPLAGVTVQLISKEGAETVLATAVTNSQGEIWFDQNDGIRPDATFWLRLSNPDDFASQGVLSLLKPTQIRQTPSQQHINSDGARVIPAAAQMVEAAVTFTPGDAFLHDIDFGFVPNTPTALAQPVPALVQPPEQAVPSGQTCLNLTLPTDRAVTQNGRFEIREYTGRLVTSWEVQPGHYTSPWLSVDNMSHTAVWVEIWFYPDGDTGGTRMTVLNPAPGTQFGWAARNVCHSLQIDWPS